jgi:hypothetical protein
MRHEDIRKNGCYQTSSAQSRKLWRKTSNLPTHKKGKYWKETNKRDRHLIQIGIWLMFDIRKWVGQAIRGRSELREVLTFGGKHFEDSWSYRQGPSLRWFPIAWNCNSNLDKWKSIRSAHFLLRRGHHHTGLPASIPNKDTHQMGLYKRTEQQAPNQLHGTNFWKGTGNLTAVTRGGRQIWNNRYNRRRAVK